MTATTLGLNGQPVKFLGAYVKQISSSLGLSISPSSVTITLVEDPLTGAVFQEPTVGLYYEISIGPTWNFGGVCKRWDRDIRNISGRQITVVLNDARDIMRSVPMIIAPGYELVAQRTIHTECAVLDIFGAYFVENSIINLSGWNQSGMEYKRIVSALHGDNITFGTTLVPIPQRYANVYGETYRFNLANVSLRVDQLYRTNSNLIPLSNLIEDLGQKHSFDWFITSERASDGVIDVTVHTIDRTQDSITLSLPTFLSNHNGKVVSCTSGVELRDVACTALMGAPVEQLLKVAVNGLANEPIDLVADSGTNTYTMNEIEMRVVMGGKDAWEIWLGIPAESGGGGGFSRYGGFCQDTHINALFNISEIDTFLIDNPNIPKNKLRKIEYLLGEENAHFENVGRIYEKLLNHAETTYGKRWAHNDIFDEIIESAWTRDAVGGNSDPNEYFRQKDGRTRCYVEFSNQDAGGAYSLGLSNLTNLFGNQNVFQNVTAFGETFSNIMPGEPGQNGTILIVELVDDFNPGSHIIDTDKSNYVYNDTDELQPSTRHSLYVAGTCDKDGVVTIPCVIGESKPDPVWLMNQIKARQEGKNPVQDADGNVLQADDLIEQQLRFLYGDALFNIAGRCYQPKYAHIPVRSLYRRYGPVFSQELTKTVQGKLEIIQDDGFCPWEFGSISLMVDAMQRKIDNATSLQKEIFTANIVVEGYPELNLGDSLEKNANINSISISFGGGGLTTSYGLQTFTRKFGEFTRDDWARIALFANSSAARTFPQNPIGSIDNSKVSVAKQFGGKPGRTIDAGAASFG